MCQNSSRLSPLYCQIQSVHCHLRVSVFVGSFEGFHSGTGIISIEWKGGNACEDDFSRDLYQGCPSSALTHCLV
jgi:hypothetical protein